MNPANRSTNCELDIQLTTISLAIPTYFFHPQKSVVFVNVQIHNKNDSLFWTERVDRS